MLVFPVFDSPIMTILAKQKLYVIYPNIYIINYKIYV